jgi:hypothetical protein
MRAAVMYEAHQPLAIENLEIAKPAAHEVLLRTAFTGLCHSDLHFILPQLARHMASWPGSRDRRRHSMLPRYSPPPRFASHSYPRHAAGVRPR